MLAPIGALSSVENGTQNKPANVITKSIPVKTLGGTALTQYSAGIHSSGHVLLDNKTLCGEVWDFAASQVVYMRVYLEQLLHI